MLSAKYKNIVKQALYENMSYSYREINDAKDTFLSDISSVLRSHHWSSSIVGNGIFFEKDRNSIKLIIPHRHYYKTIQPYTSLGVINSAIKQFKGRILGDIDNEFIINTYKSVNFVTVLNFVSVKTMEFYYDPKLKTISYTGILTDIYISQDDERTNNCIKELDSKYTAIPRITSAELQQAVIKEMDRIFKPIQAELDKNVGVTNLYNLNKEEDTNKKSNKEPKQEKSKEENTQNGEITYLKNGDIELEDGEKITAFQQKRILEEYKSNSTLKPITIYPNNKEPDSQLNKNLDNTELKKAKAHDGSIKSGTQTRYTADALLGIDNSYRHVDLVAEKARLALLNHINKEFENSDGKETDETYSMKMLLCKIMQSKNGLPCEDTKFDGVSSSTNMSENYANSDFTETYYIDDAGNKEPNLLTVRNLLHVWAMEILSPMVLASMYNDNNTKDKRIHWGKGVIDGKEISSRHILLSLFGNKKSFKDSLIYFPPSGHPLSDSILAIPTSDEKKWNTIEISTKGGGQGVGAPASIAGLLSKVVVPIKEEIKEAKEKKYREPKIEFADININFNGNTEQYKDVKVKEELRKEIEDKMESFVKNNYLTKGGLSLYTEHKPAITLLVLLCEAKNSKNQKNLLQCMAGNELFDLSFKKEDTIEKLLYRLNNGDLQKEMTYVIQELLNRQAYDFVQIDCRGIIEGEDLHFDYTIQYPALFQGKIHFDPPVEGRSLMKFHILGAKSS